MDAKQAKQLRVNTRNIDALAAAMEAQSKQIEELQGIVKVQANSLTTLGNELVATRKAMAHATATMGHGATAG